VLKLYDDGNEPTFGPSVSQGLANTTHPLVFQSKTPFVPFKKLTVKEYLTMWITTSARPFVGGYEPEEDENTELYDNFIDAFV
jgi:hypothetical protein